jgi:heat shock protein HslJ
MKKIFLWILLVGISAALILSACSAAEISLDGSSWTLKSYQDSNGETVNVLPRSTTTALFQADQVTGIAGCNNYNASYQATRNKLSFGPVATTRKACNTPSGIMQQENAFLAALDSTVSYKLSINSLEMIDSKGKTLLMFRKSNE